MSPKIKKRLKGVRTLLKTQLFINWAVKGLAFGAALTLLLMILGKFAPLGLDFIRTSILFLAAGAVIGAIASLVRPVTIFDAAFACDVRLGLKERISSAVEFNKIKDTNPLIPALITDAENYAARIRPGRDFPLRFPREIIYSIILVAFTVGLYFVPPWQYVLASEEQKNEFVDIRSEAERVRQLAREIILNPPPDRTDFAEEIARELEELARDMEFGTLTRREALARLSAIEEAIEQVQSESGYDELREQLNRVALALNENENLQDAADALANGDPEAARNALNQIADDLESGRIPIESLDDLADALDRAANSMDENAETAGLRDALSRASEELRSASSESGSGSENQNDPEEMARQLIDAIDRAIPEIDDLDVPEEVREQAIEMLEEIRDDLQAALDSGEITQQDIRDAQQRIQEVRRMLEDAGADLGGEEDTRTEEEIASELIEEAERLERVAENNRSLESETRNDLQNTCQEVAESLQDQISQGACSSGSNLEARRRLDEVRRQLEEAGASEEQMGESTQCSGGQCQNGQQGSQSGNRPGAGMQGLFGMQSDGSGTPGNMGQGSESRGRAGQAMRDAAGSLSRFGQCLSTGQCLDKISSGICQSRSNISGACQTPGQSSQTGRASSGWGTGTSPYAVDPIKNQAGHQSENRQDDNETPNQYTDYQELYSPNIESGSSYDVQLEGKFTDVGGSYVFTEITDPQTGETSYVPYFSIEPADVVTLMDAIEDQDIPRSYEEFVRFYFEQLARGSNPNPEPESESSPETTSESSSDTGSESESE